MADIIPKRKNRRTKGKTVVTGYLTRKQQRALEQMQEIDKRVKEQQ